jgi:hypothetical protein
MLQEGYEGNASLNWLRLVAVTGCCPKPYLSMPAEFTPVDVAAHAVVSLAEMPATGCVFHVFCPPTQCVADVIGVMQDCGINVETVEKEVFEQRLHRLQDNKKAALSLAVAAETRSFGIREQWHDDDFTKQMLMRCGHEMPPLPHGYIERTIKELARNGFLKL